MIHNFINIEKWNALPPAYKSIVRTASSMANEWMQARYDAANPGALKRLVAGGAQLRPFTQAVMDASPRPFFQTASQVVEAALSANDRGQAVVVPGWHNKIAAALLQYLPRGLVRAALMKGSARYHLD